jgi:hypothetical protein
MQSALRSYDSAGRSVNSMATVPTLEATFFLGFSICEEMDKSKAIDSARLRPRQRPVL